MNRYSDNKIIRTGKKNHYKVSILPNTTDNVNDIYIVTKRGDRLDLLAYNYYNDKTKWYIIAIANNLGNGSMILEPGLNITIPYNTNI